ncbi:DUF1990 domain-containing protein [Tsukamurella sp. 8F]|uniref:DUF1990 family protein n=1 Tax=unclassified Tsukamurella TaxID=2633480 RepID=UPI0023B94683|nr:MULTISPECIES: DUF1990 domain-containing protein [unclassified Tsukamurella]MDF0532298.1 DUF1990 domain-containing protein [Tsukamurella sp. 8J]MDF0588999.1 DUF1990 domain-containing protein [Tsukamurella sp. 8F]
MRLLRRGGPAAFTYPGVGSTAPGGKPPGGWDVLRHERTVGRGRDDFAAVRTLILEYGMQRGAGMRVSATTPVAQPETGLRLRLLPFAPAFPARVVYVLDEPELAGFAYGTLPGHPERGEEFFGVELRGDDVVAFVYAFSRPGNPLVWLGAPVARALQRVYARRYLAAVEAGL